MKNMKNANKAMDMEMLLRKLPEAADAAMGGLTATPFMKAKIDRAVAEAKQPQKQPLRLPRWMPAAVCCALVLVIALTALPMLNQEEGPGLQIDSETLGQPTAVPSGALSADLRNGSVFISSNRGEPGYRSIWSDMKGGSFPLIGVNGRYYRLLTSPRDVDSALLGSCLGQVAEYTTEPSLSGTDVILSNTVPLGTEVYAIRGMDSTLVAAKMNGSMRLFQRVSFNGNARRGSEKLADTLQVKGQVIALELSGVGTITEPAVCETLIALLLKDASYESSGSITSKQSLLIELENGLVLQMAVRGDNLASCGVWSSPDFFEAFEDACN